MSFTNSTFGWFEKQSIQAKFRLVFGLIGGLAAVALVIVVVGVMRIEASNGNYVQVVEASRSVATVQARLGTAELNVERAVRSGDAAGITAARAVLDDAGDAAQRAADGLREVAPDLAGSAEGLRDAIASYDNALASLSAQFGDAAARSAAVDLALERQVAVESGIASVLQGENAAAASFQEEVEGHTSTLLFSLAVLALVALVNIFGAFSVVRSAITRPLDRITGATRKLVAGESDVTIPCTERAHEIGELARALKVFKDNMIEMERLQAAAADDANSKLREQEEREAAREDALKQRSALLNDLVDRFERTVGEVVNGVAAASGELQATATSMATSAEQSAQQAGEVSTALTEASSGVTAAAAASDEFAMSIGEISRQASTSADLARTAATNAADADKTISALNSAANQIGQIVELISSIAQRTNLLALNASIEAARGGEAGRGFAVVASEVKDLAAQTSKATDDVAEQIRTIQESTAASVQALRTIGEHVGQLESTSISIAAAVDQQSVAGQDLARSIDMAARNTDDVSSNIGQVREGTLATGAAASQVLSSSSQLQSQAGSLKAKAEEFLAQIRAA